MLLSQNACEGTCFLMWVNKTESLDQYIALRLIAINVHTHTHTLTHTHTHFSPIATNNY